MSKRSASSPATPSFFSRTTLVVALAVIYAAGASWSAWHVVVRTQASTTAIEHILETYSLKNEAAKQLQQYTKQHPFLGLFISGPVKKTMNLPSEDEASNALGPEIRNLLKTVRRESSRAAWWSWFLLILSALYFVAVVAVERRHNARPVLFSLTAISVTFFAIGVLAPAMVIWTAPDIPMETGTLNFVVQHQVRGIAAIIWELIKGGHWIIGGFLLLFSIITPLTKASLTFFITASHNKERNLKIGKFLHTIGKWSMADVFVAAILLALYALKFQEATKSVPCLGLYYFIGYCLLALTTTELLVNSDVVTGNEGKRKPKIGLGGVLGLLAALISFAAVSSLYTYQQYTENTKQRVTPSSLPQKLNNSDLVLPIHK